MRSDSVEPARIAQFVSNMRSDSVEAPRNLSTLSLSRLDDISNMHGGEVLLHGRLFMQWMHHAYPRECPFPHVSGTLNPESQWEMVSPEEKQKHMAKDLSLPAMTHDEVVDAIPWSTVEELVAGHTRDSPKTGIMEKLRFVVGVLALV